MEMTKVREGDRVMFGPRNGLKTLGEVVGKGPKRLTIKQLEPRKSKGKVKPVGEMWTVPPDMCTPATEQDISRALGPTRMELAQMGTTVAFPCPRPSPYTRDLFEKAFDVCEALTQAAVFWTEEEEEKNPYLVSAQDAAAAFLKEAQSRGLRR